jgi:hypothetical protein
MRTPGRDRLRDGNIRTSALLRSTEPGAVARIERRTDPRESCHRVDHLRRMRATDRVMGRWQTSNDMLERLPTEHLPGEAHTGMTRHTHTPADPSIIQGSGHTPDSATCAGCRKTIEARFGEPWRLAKTTRANEREGPPQEVAQPDSTRPTSRHYPDDEDGATTGKPTAKA